jgi:hypothetical protein
MKVVQIVACVYVAWTKTFCMAVILLYICVYPVDIVKVTHFQLQNFRIFVDFGILPGFFRWFRADASKVLPARIHSYLGSTYISVREDKSARRKVT